MVVGHVLVLVGKYLLILIRVYSLNEEIKMVVRP